MPCSRNRLYTGWWERRDWEWCDVTLCPQNSVQVVADEKEFENYRNVRRENEGLMREKEKKKKGRKLRQTTGWKKKGIVVKIKDV